MRAFALPAALLLLPLLGSPAQAGPYDRLDGLLKRYVNKEGLVDYATLKQKDGATLKGGVHALAKVDAKALRGDAKKAYWINVYNVLAIDTVVRHYPAESIRDVGSFLSPVWKREASDAR